MQTIFSEFFYRDNASSSWRSFWYIDLNFPSSQSCTLRFLYLYIYTNPFYAAIWIKGATAATHSGKKIAKKKWNQNGKMIKKNEIDKDQRRFHQNIEDRRWNASRRLALVVESAKKTFQMLDHPSNVQLRCSRQCRRCWRTVATCCTCQPPRAPCSPTATSCALD